VADYLRYGLIALGCCLLLGGASFFALKRWLPKPGDRMGIALPAMLLALAGALLIPPALVVLRGDSVLPAWTAVLLFVVLALALPSFWRSVLNHLPASAGGEPADMFAAETVETYSATDAAAPFGVAHHDMASDRTLADSAPEAPEGAGNLLADIARSRADHTRADQTREELTQLPDDTAFGAVVELLPTEHRAQSEMSYAEPPVSPPEPLISLVPEPVPPGIPFLRLLDKAWEERACGRPVQAASWFLACLSRNATPQPLRHEILTDLCALLKEHHYEREALALLDADLVAGCAPELRRQIARELTLSMESADRN
jgi:hypothetical protein